MDDWKVGVEAQQGRQSHPLKDLDWSVRAGMMAPSSCDAARQVPSTSHHLASNKPSPSTSEQNQDRDIFLAHFQTATNALASKLNCHH